MKIRFSDGIDFWIDIIEQFLLIIDNFWFEITGSHLFAGAPTPAEEETTAA